MRKSLILISTLALSLGVAGAQTAAPATSPVPVTLTDVPAGHWAKDAVDRIVACGLIQGFPDGTFRGNENLTRYQAALMFYRLLQTGAAQHLRASAQRPRHHRRRHAGSQHRAGRHRARVTDLKPLTAEQQARITALEGRIDEMGNAAAGAGTDTAALTARIDALEAAIRNIPAGPAGATGPAGPAGAAADTAALAARIAALEARATTADPCTGP